MNSSTKSQNGKAKILIFYLILFFIPWIVIDLCAFVYLRMKEQRTSQYFELKLPPDDLLERYCAKSFHPRWGWDIMVEKRAPLGNRKSHPHKTKSEYTIKVFGDSFAYGNRVEDNETFEYFIEEQTEWDCLNFAVEAYGTDQAFLKYKDNSVKTKYTVLCILDENIARVVNIWRGFYYNSDPYPKPRFVLSGEGLIQKLESPVKDCSELRKLQDPEFVNSLKKYDYWPMYHERRQRVFEFKIKWPATLTLVKNIKFFTNKLQDKLTKPGYENVMSIQNLRGKYFHLYNEDSEAFKILCYIVSEFVRTTNSRGEIPIIVIFPTIQTVKIQAKYGKKPYQVLVDYLQEKQCEFIDFGEVFIKEDYRRYYSKEKNNHFSVEGNRRIAAELIRQIRRYEE